MPQSDKQMLMAKLVGDIIGYDFNLNQLKEIEIALHEAIRQKGGTPMNTSTIDVLEEPIVVSEREENPLADVGDVRDSKKKVINILRI